MHARHTHTHTRRSDQLLSPEHNDGIRTSVKRHGRLAAAWVIHAGTGSCLAPGWRVVCTWPAHGANWPPPAVIGVKRITDSLHLTAAGWVPTSCRNWAGALFAPAGEGRRCNRPAAGRRSIDVERRRCSLSIRQKSRAYNRHSDDEGVTGADIRATSNDDTTPDPRVSILAARTRPDPPAQLCFRQLLAPNFRPTCCRLVLVPLFFLSGHIAKPPLYRPK